MIELSMDINTSVTILTGLTAVLGFFWTIFEKLRKRGNSSDETDENSPFARQTEEIDKLRTRIEELEQSIRDHSSELEKLSELVSIAKDENARIRHDFLDNLDRIENRLEKMIDLILRIKRDE